MIYLQVGGGGFGFSYFLPIIIFVILIVLFINRIKKFKGSSNSIQTKKSKSTALTDDFRVMEIQESETKYESIGQEFRNIDNSKGNGMVKRKLSISKEWKKEVEISETKSYSNKISGGISSYFIKLKGDMENSVEEKYNISKSETNIFSEEIEIEIMPYSKIQLKIEWKNIWKIGFIELKNSQEKIVKIPYKVSGGLTFDQTIEKVN